MSIRKLILLHFSYCFNKRNLLLVISNFVLMQIITIFIYLNNQNLNLNDYEKMDIIWQTSFALVKIIYGAIGIFLFGNFCLLDNDEYQYLLLNKTTKGKYYLTKFLTLILLMIVLLFINLLCFSIFGIFFNKGFILNSLYLNSYLYLMIIILLYGTIGMILVRITNSILSVMVTLVLYLASSSWENFDLVKFLLPPFDLDIINGEVLLISFLCLLLYHLIAYLIFLEKRK